MATGASSENLFQDIGSRHLGIGVRLGLEWSKEAIGAKKAQCRVLWYKKIKTLNIKNKERILKVMK